MPVSGSTLKLAAIALLSMAITPALSAEPIELAIDTAKVLKLQRPAGTIAVGNPDIADATVIDATTLVLTGKAAGLTNILVLDQQGGEFSDYSVRVITRGGKYVSVRSSQGQRSFFCDGICDSAPANERVQQTVATAMPSAGAVAPDAPATPAAAEPMTSAVEQAQAETAEHRTVF